MFTGTYCALPMAMDEIASLRGSEHHGRNTAGVLNAAHRCLLAATAHTAVNGVNTHQSATDRPIEIYVSCPWAKRGKSTVPVRQDRRWAFLRSLIKKVVDECYARIR